MSQINITAERVTETGVLSNGEWLNFSKFGSRPEVEAGRDYEIEYKEFKGRKYINSVRELQKAGPPAPAATPAKALRPAAKATTKTASGAGHSEVTLDFAAREDTKGRRILIQGILQACLHSPAIAGFVADQDEYLDAVEAATKREVSFVDEMVG